MSEPRETLPSAEGVARSGVATNVDAAIAEAFARLAAAASDPAGDRALAEFTPARLAAGRAGPAYRTATQLELREAHAAATDAVRTELVPERDWGSDFLAQWRFVCGETEAATKDEYLLRPERGRRLSAATRETLVRECPPRADVQIAAGDGLSARAAAVQIPRLLPPLVACCAAAGLSVGRPIYLRHARVGVLNDLGDLLDPAVVVLLIGERPGLATAESLSAYLAYRPRAGDTDARRNLISNIHERGVPTDEAARRIAGLVQKLVARRASGVEVKE